MLATQVAFLDTYTGLTVPDGTVVNIYSSPTEIDSTTLVDSQVIVGGNISSSAIYGGNVYYVTMSGPNAPTGIYTLYVTVGGGQNTLTLNSGI